LSQFMPQNIPRFGKDGDNDGKIDLFNPSDAILSTANFLAIHERMQCKKHRQYIPVQHGLVHYLGAHTPYQTIVMKYSDKLRNFGEETVLSASHR
jgi:membrane-bound lytic murein transglycosylase B